MSMRRIAVQKLEVTTEVFELTGGILQTRHALEQQQVRTTKTLLQRWWKINSKYPTIDVRARVWEGLHKVEKHLLHRRNSMNRGTVATSRLQYVREGSCTRSQSDAPVPARAVCSHGVGCPSVTPCSFVALHLAPPCSLAVDHLPPPQHRSRQVPTEHTTINNRSPHHPVPDTTYRQCRGTQLQ